MSTDLTVILGLEELYSTYGVPKVYPKPPEGVRFFDGTAWLTRRHWVWVTKRDREYIHPFIRIDEYSDRYVTVAGTDEVHWPRVALTTYPPPTAEQIVQVIRLAQL